MKYKYPKTELSDFLFEFRGKGHYKVTYTSPTTYKSWSCITNDMELIDRTKNEDSPKRKYLNDLKFICKNNH